MPLRKMQVYFPKQEIDYIQMRDPVLRQIDFVEGKNVFWGSVTNWGKGAEFAFNRLRAWKQIRHLDEAFPRIIDRHEIDLALICLTDEHLKAPGEQFVVNEVFQEIRILVIDQIGIDIP